MKYAYNIWISSALLLVVAACNREPVNPDDTQRPGENMSIQLTMDTQPLVTKSTFVPAENGMMEADAITKTSYSGEVFGGYERIDWTVNDVIRLFTDNEGADGNQTWTGNSSVGKMTDYKVTGVTPSGNKSFATITPNSGQKALKWGNGAHEVFGFYPTPSSSGVSANFSGHSGPLKFSGMTLNGAVDFNAIRKSGIWNFTAAPPMTQAYLWGAASLASPVGKLEMPFRPLFNAIEVQFTRQDILGSATLPSGKAAADFRLNAVTLTSVGKDVKAKYDVAFAKGSSWQQATSTTTINNNNGKTVRYDFPAYGAASGNLTTEQNKQENHVYASTGYTVRFFLPFNSYGASDGLKITFEFKHSDNSTTYTRTLLLKRTSSEWLTMDPGDKIVLSPGEAAVWEYVLEVNNCAPSTTPVVYIEAGDTGDKESSFQVKSYRRNKNNPAQTEPVKWVTYINKGDRGTGSEEWVHFQNYTPQQQLKAGWLAFGESDANKPMGEGGLNPQARPVYARSYSYTELNPSNPSAFFKDAIALNLHRYARSSGISNLNNPSAAIDLSLFDINGRVLEEGRSTANCYVVPAPGWYKIPLVYGNMIKNGATNSSAAQSYHVDHTGKAITNPWIKDQLGNPNFTPELVWQARELKDDGRPDEDNLPLCDKCDHHHGVIDIHTAFISQDKKFLVFNVPQHSIIPDNNVIGVKVNGELVWSWHIWVTEQEFRTVDSRYLNTVIGWIPVSLNPTASSATIHPERSEHLKVVQVLDNGQKNPDGLEGDLLFYQFGNVSTVFDQQRLHYYGRGVYFQWGRKDPMFPAQSTGGNNRTQLVYDGGQTKLAGGNSSMPRENGNGKNIAYAVKNPGKFLTNSSPFDKKNGNPYWSPDVKTVYDPSPTGYRVIDRFYHPTGYAHFYDSYKKEHKKLNLENSYNYRYSSTSYRGWPGAYLGGGGNLYLPDMGVREHLDAELRGAPTGRTSFGSAPATSFWSAEGTRLQCDLSANWSAGQVSSWNEQGNSTDGYPVVCIVE